MTRSLGDMLDSPLTELERKEIARMLEGHARRGGLTFSQLDGLVCSLAIGPNTIVPSVWLPLVWGEAESGFDTMSDVQRGYSLLLRHYNAVVVALREGTYEPTYVSKIRDDEQSRAQQWATGFMAGMSLDHEWKALVDDARDNKALFPIFILADARAMIRGYERDPDAAEAFITAIPLVLPIIQAFWRGRRTLPKRRTASPSPPKKNTPRRQTATAARSIHRLKIQLRDVKPVVWRRIEIASDTKLPALSRALLAAMGWNDTHLHAFRIGREVYGPKDPEWDDDMIDERHLTLGDLLPFAGDEFDFDYDFGDGWRHRVTVETIVRADAAATYPRCVAGRRACPPDDCGGPDGYKDFVKAIGDQRHPEHKRMKEWGGPFEPDAFDLEEINLALDAFFQRRRTKRS